MVKIHSREEFDGFVGQSVFLVGPTPRAANPVPSWRPGCIELFEKHGFDGTLIVPEDRGGKIAFNYLNQTNWEYEGLHRADVILAWIPRGEALPGYTTNIEFGYWLAKEPSKLIYGRPPGADRIRYLDWFYEKETNKKPQDNLESLVLEVLDSLKLRTVEKALP